MSKALPPAGYDELQRSEFTRIFGRIVGVRMYIAPVVASLVLLLAVWEPAPWRRVVLLTLPLVMLTVSITELVRYRRAGMGPHALELNLLLAVFGQLTVSFVTGGVESPAMPVMLVLTLLLGLVGDRVWYHWAALLAQLAAPWVFASIAVEHALPEYNLHLFGGGPRPGHSDTHLWTAVAVFNFATLISYSVGAALRRIFDGMLWRAMEANDALRREQAERSQALVALTSEIAHELKNPMSSVKGLAALLAQSVPEGKGAERLGVLRSELDRMQAILGEFLNFSRPLLPLTVAEAELRAVCDEVAALHEGVARERGVSLEVEGRAKVRCDARKVRQALTNLVQNAIDASPRGSAILLRCDGSGQGATVRVLDRGAGIDAAIRPRLFEPGATSKPNGNGVGLTFARSLARQHGGDLVLEPREGGGCAAVLSLPPEPVAGERALEEAAAR